MKVKSQLKIKRKNGVFVGNYAFYGYVKKDGKLTVDTYVADIVKSIFESKISGYNEAKIVSMLNSKGILSPAEYKKAMGVAYNTPFGKGEKALWSVSTVRRMLINRVWSRESGQKQATE